MDGRLKAFAQGGALALTAHGEFYQLEDHLTELKLWNPFKEHPVAAMPIHPDLRGTTRTESAVFAPNGGVFATSQISEYQGIRPSYDNAMLRLWEQPSGQQITILSPTITKTLAFSPSGRLLASGGTGKSGHLRVGYGEGIDVWDILTRKKIGTLPVTPECVAFSPNGGHLATGGRDHNILLWEAPKLPAPQEVEAPSKEQRDTWWTHFAGSPDEAYKAMGQMVEMPDHAIAFLRERLKPVEASDPKEVARLIEQLKSEKYPERMKAQAALENMGEGPAHLLRKAMAGDIHLELRRRLEGILARCEAPSPSILRQIRTVALLEWMDTKASREQLRSYASGAPDARLTREAEGVLKRRGEKER